VLPDLLLQFSISWPHRKRLRVSSDTKAANLIGNSDTIGSNSYQKVEGVQSRADGGSVRHRKGAPLKIREFAIPIPDRDRRRVSRKRHGRREFRLVVRISALVSAFGLGWIIGSSLYSYFDRRDELTDTAAVNAVVERIIAVESDGDPNAKNSRSSATGLGQFLNDTWLELIREYRPDLTRGRSESQTLELRRDTKLAREITTRSVEHNATMLRQRGLPISAGAVYLAHFAGAAGAVAILSASDGTDAASVLAGADATGRTKREQLIKANPFLEHLTVADLKIWAERKMRGLDLHPTEVRAATARQ